MPARPPLAKRALSSPAPGGAPAKERRISGPTAVLDHSAYPHILDTVLAVATWPSLLALRTACKSLRDRIDGKLYAHITLREQVYDLKLARTNYKDWYTPSRVEIRDADGHRLPGVRWEVDIPWPERVDAAFRMRQFTRTADVVDDLTLDNQETLPQAELRALPDERRRLVREHDGNLLRVALSSLDGMRIYDISTLCSLPVKTQVQYSGVVTSWDGYHPDPSAIFCSTHTDPLDKLVVVFQWDPALKLLENTVVMWGDERSRTNSFYRHRNRACEPREVVLVLQHDTRHVPDLRLGDLGRRIDNNDQPEEPPGEFGMISTIVDYIGEKLGMVDKITVVGLETVLAHITRDERGDELHEVIRESAREHWDRVFLSVTDKAAYQAELHRDDLYVGQLQSHPEFHRIAIAEYWKVMRRNRQMQGWGGFQLLGNHGLNFAFNPGMFTIPNMNGGDDDDDDDGDLDDDDDDGDLDDDDEEMDDDEGAWEDIDEDTGHPGPDLAPPTGWFLGPASYLNPQTFPGGASDTSAEGMSDSDAGNDGPSGDDANDGDDPAGDADAADATPPPVSDLQQAAAAMALALQHAADSLGTFANDDMSTAPTTPASHFRLPTPPSPTTIWADEVTLSKVDTERRAQLTALLARATAAARAGEPVDTASLGITLDEWYLMANYSRERLPCTVEQLDPRELVELSLIVPTTPPLVRGHAEMVFMTHEEYESSVGKEVYAWETDGYEWKTHQKCSCSALPIGEE